MDGHPAPEDRRAAPASVRIAAELRRDIAAGRLRPGDRVPSTREITRRWGVAMATATKVITTLRQEGLVRTLPGVGTVVGEPRPAPRPAPTGPAAQGRSARRRPGAGTRLARSAVVRTAVEIADAEGLEGVSMRRVAAELGAAPMALYRHVPAKEDLLRLMVEAVFAEHPPPDPAPEGLRAALAAGARVQWRLCRRHPWVVRLMSIARPVLTPSTVDHTEWAVRVLTRHGVGGAEALHAVVALTGYVLGMATQVSDDTEAAHETGLHHAQWWAAREPVLSRLEATGRYPHLFAHAAPPPDLDESFEFGLEGFLAGLEARLVGGPGR
ncbi:TetR/AcrR family transcriptional regulator C-terminal domain-containing protein [Streptomonospora sp. S1-112]|uniref:TetR/AcrR family transcriptional regulator C-terminal domain-containing protein n=1 Tax=Streptomonospora mangrovi TaxID=2883123 RepID=A0A9X3NNI9_9ACTN|nr:TetR/AcrR family transcriptional regulator C-terminal domain-containing protein [Streptomonospora mangrovi]MDA0567022.1 TetR/AcrR family transcriptional regulator C-terminal domain-containing protein [Streptomonospora mangrovi]